MEYGGNRCFSSVLSSRAYYRIPWNSGSLDLLRFPKFSVLDFGVQEGVWCCMGMWAGICDSKLRKNTPEPTRIAQNQRIPQNHRTPGSHRTPGGTQCTDTEIYCHFGSSGSVIFHTWPSSRLAFNPSPQWPLRPERLMKKTRRHILSRNIIWETMDSQVLTAGWTRALGHDRTWQEKRRAWQGSQNLIFTIRGQSFFPRFPELFSHGIWSALEYG